MRDTEFATGEGFAYLGRSYRLLLVDEQDVPLKLQRGRFRLVRSNRDGGREHFVDWYRTVAPSAHQAGGYGRKAR